MFRTSDLTILTAAGASFIASIALWFLIDRQSGLYVGLWVPSILALWAGVRLCSLDLRKEA